MFFGAFNRRPKTTLAGGSAGKVGGFDAGNTELGVWGNGMVLKILSVTESWTTEALQLNQRLSRMNFVTHNIASYRVI